MEMDANESVLKTMDKSESHPNQYKHCVTILSLQEIASSRVALSLWYNYISTATYDELYKNSKDYLIKTMGLNDNYLYESKKRVEFLDLPNIIEEMVKRSLHLIAMKIGEWV